MASGMRTLVSYDDITLPYQASPLHSPSNKPPTKKRKWNKNAKGRNQNDAQRHANDIGQAPSKTATDHEMEESRDLTHDEIWDDSALIDAWNAAAEEYEAYHGPDKGWKKEPIHKSPLWYNIPKATGKDSYANTNGQISAPTVPESDEHEDSKPLDFNTFMPSHNPALDISSLGPENLPHLPDASGPVVSQDEAFKRALEAMYWSGYWTAMYHAQRRHPHQQSPDDEVQQGEEDLIDEDEEEEEEEEEDAFVSTQR